MDLLILAALIAIGYFIGGSVERKHFAQLAIDEQALMNIPHSNLKKITTETTQEPVLLHASVVISQDYFKRIMGIIVGIFGGRIHAYETLLDRARREAVVRLKKQAQSKNVSAVYNLRLETSSISKGSTENNQVGTVEVIAYATGIKA